MKLCIIIFAFLLSLPGFSQAIENDPAETKIAAIPKALANKALPANGLIPKGFKQAARATGDLNGDGVDDIALIIRDDGAKPNKNEPAPALRQIVLIFLGNGSGQYSFWKVGAKHFFDASENQMDEGGIGDFSIKNGVLNINATYAMSMGGWSAGGCDQKWRNEKAGFRLIGLTQDNYRRNGGPDTTLDTNYVTGITIKSITSSGPDDDAKDQVKKIKNKSQVILWENFDFDKFCSL